MMGSKLQSSREEDVSQVHCFDLPCTLDVQQSISIKQAPQQTINQQQNRQVTAAVELGEVNIEYDT